MTGAPPLGVAARRRAADLLLAARRTRRNNSDFAEMLDEFVYRDGEIVGHGD